MSLNTGATLGNARASIGLNTKGFVLGLKEAEAATLRTERGIKTFAASSQRAFTLVGTQVKYARDAFSLFATSELQVSDAAKNMVGQIERSVAIFRDATVQAQAYINKLNDLRNFGTRNEFGRNIGLQNAILKGEGAQIGRAGPSFVPDFRNANTAATGLLGTVGKLAGSFGLALAALSLIRTALNAIRRAFDQLITSSIRYADTIKISRVMFAGYLGSLEASKNLLQNIQVQSQKMGLSFQETLSIAQQLVPALANAGESVERMNDALSVTRRLSLFNLMGAQGGVEGAGIAIAEAMASQGRNLISIERRFNIASENLKPFIEQNQGDVISALDQYFQSLGITDEMAKELTSTMEASVGRLGEAISRFGGTVLAPFLDNVIIPFINYLTATINTIANLIQVLYGSAESFRPIVDAFNAIWENFTDILRIIGVIRNQQTDKQRTGEGGVAQVMSIVSGVEFVIQGVLASIKLIPISIEFLLSAFNVLQKTVFLVSNALMSFAETALMLVLQIAAVLNELGADIDTSGIQGMLASIILMRAEFTDTALALNQSAELGIEAARELQAEINRMIEEGLQPVDVGADLPELPDQIDQDAVDQVVEYFEKVEEINDQYNQDLLDAEREYRQERRELIAEFNKDQRREDQDFARDREKARHDLNDKISDLETDLSNDRDKITRESNERLEKLTAEYNEDAIIRLDEHLLKRQRAEEDHNDKLRDAAARLDAIAMIREIEQYNKEQRRAQEDFDRDQALRQQQFEQKFVQEQAALEVELQIRDQAAQAKIQRLIEEFNYEDGLARQEFAIKRQREQEDLQARLQALDIQYNNELALMFDAHNRELIELHRHYQNVLTAQNIAYAQMLNMENDALGNMVNNWVSAYQALQQAGIQPPVGGGGSSREGGNINLMQHTGGLQNFTGNVRLERGEGILQASATRQIMNELGGFSQREIVNRVRGAGGGINFAPTLQFSINGAQDPVQLGENLKDLLDEHLFARFEGYIRGDRTNAV